MKKVDNVFNCFGHQTPPEVEDKTEKTIRKCLTHITSLAEAVRDKCQTVAVVFKVPQTPSKHVHLLWSAAVWSDTMTQTWWSHDPQSPGPHLLVPDPRCLSRVLQVLWFPLCRDVPVPSPPQSPGHASGSQSPTPCLSRLWDPVCLVPSSLVSQSPGSRFSPPPCPSFPWVPVFPCLSWVPLSFPHPPDSWLQLIPFSPQCLCLDSENNPWRQHASHCG